jgi:hypothetical protein
MFFVSPIQSLQFFFEKGDIFFLLKSEETQKMFFKIFFFLVFLPIFCALIHMLFSLRHTKNNKSSKYDTKLPECVSVSFCRCVWWLCVTFSIRRWFKRQEEKQTKCTRWENKTKILLLFFYFSVLLSIVIFLLHFYTGNVFSLFLNWCIK